MSQQTLNNSESGLSIRGKVNDNFTELYARGSGAVVAVRSVTKTDTQSTTNANGTWDDVTGLSITHTPSASTNKILLRADLYCGSGATVNGIMLRFVRGSTAIGIGDAAGSRVQATTGNINPVGDVGYPVAMSFLDAPATTSATTWKVQFCVLTGGSGTAYINRSAVDGTSSYYIRGISTFTLFEVLP